MQNFLAASLLILSYLFGSIPFGLLIVRLTTGKDVRKIESGRTGATNTMRAAGLWAGLITAFFDILKGAGAVWVVRFFASSGWISSSPWLEILAPIFAVIGHNYSIFLLERNEQGQLRTHGGAGGTPALGGALGLWAPSVLISLPIGAFLLFGVGYASVATLSVGIVTGIIFATRAWLGTGPWQYVLYSLVVLCLLAWSLRPNIKRLLNGTERVVGWRARKKNAPKS